MIDTRRFAALSRDDRRTGALLSFSSPIMKAIRAKNSRAVSTGRSNTIKTWLHRSLASLKSCLEAST